jgi:hypothetical protein
MRALFGRASVSAAFVVVVAACANPAPLGVGGSTNAGNGVTEAEYDIALKKWQAGAPSLSDRVPADLRVLGRRAATDA